MTKELHINALCNGTSIDHIPANTALELLERLELSHEGITTIALNVESKKLGRKDLVFIENKELSDKEIDKVALLARGATINIIKDYDVKKKIRLGIPSQVEGIMQCINPNCITNLEHIPTKFSIQKEPFKAKCYYCEKTMEQKEIEKAIK